MILTIPEIVNHNNIEKLQKFRGKNGKHKDYAPNEVIAEIKKAPLEFEPGTQWSYAYGGEYYSLAFKSLLN